MAKAKKKTYSVSGVVGRNIKDFPMDSTEGFGINVPLRDPVINGKQVPYKRDVFHQICAAHGAIQKVEGITQDPKTGEWTEGSHFVESGDFVIAPKAGYSKKVRTSKDGRRTTTHSYWVNEPSDFEFTKGTARLRRNRSEAKAQPRRSRPKG